MIFENHTNDMTTIELPTLPDGYIWEVNQIADDNPIAQSSHNNFLFLYKAVKVRKNKTIYRLVNGRPLMPYVDAADIREKAEVLYAMEFPIAKKPTETLNQFMGAYRVAK